MIDVIKFRDYLAKSFGLDKSTAHQYASRIKKFFERIQKPPQRITIQDLIQFFQQLYDEGYAQSTQITYLAAIRAYYDYLVQIGQMDVNVARMFKRRFRVPRKLPDVITIEQVDRMIREPFKHNHDNIRAMFESAVIAALGSTGIRRAELCNLTIDDVNVETRTIRVRGKRQKERIVPVVSKWFSEDPFPKIVWLLEKAPEDLYPKKIERIVKKYGWIVCRKNVTPHTLRHTFATQLIKDGVPIEVVKEIMGHDSIVTTEKYVHLAHKDVLDELRKVGII